MWLIVAVIGFALAAVVNVLDKYVLDNTVKKPVVFVFFSTVWGLLFLLTIPFFGFLSSPLHYLIVLLAGFCFVVGLWAMFIGIQKSEISHIGPFIGAVVPVFIFIWSRFLFHEAFSLRQLCAIFLLVLGTLIIAGEKSTKHDGLHHGLFWGFLGAFLWSIFSVGAKYVYEHNQFTTGFIWVQGAVGLTAACLLFTSTVRHTLQWKKAGLPLPFKKIILVAVDKFLGLVSLVLVQYAVALGSVTLVYALAGIQYAVLICLVAILTKIGSRFFSEQYSRGEIVQEIIAVIIIGLGLAILV